MSTILVTIKSFTNSDKAAPTSRIRIEQAVYDAEIAAAEAEDRPCKYTLEEDQACEGMIGDELAKAQAERKPIREKKEKLLAEAAAL